MIFFLEEIILECVNCSVSEGRVTDNNNTLYVYQYLVIQMIDAVIFVVTQKICYLGYNAVMEQQYLPKFLSFCF